MYQYRLAPRGGTARCAIRSMQCNSILQDCGCVIWTRQRLAQTFTSTVPQHLPPVLRRHCLCEIRSETWIVCLTLLGLCWQVVIEKQKLHVGVKGQPAILNGEMYAAVKPDDSFWNSDGTALEITLQKVCPGLLCRLRAHRCLRMPCAGC